MKIPTTNELLKTKIVRTDTEIHAKLEAIWTAVRKIGEHLDIDYFKVTEDKRLVADDSIDPDLIPF